MRVDLLLTDRPITPSGTGRAAPPVCCPELRPTGRRCSRHLLDLKSGRGSGAPEITKDQPLGGGPLRKLDYIIGVMGHPWSRARCGQRSLASELCQGSSGARPDPL